MTKDNPGGRVMRGPQFSKFASYAWPKPSPKPSASEIREDGVRRSRLGRSSSLDIHEFLKLDVSERSDAVLPSGGVDPGMVAARRMVLRAVKESRAGKKVGADGGLTVVAVPGPEWLETVSAQWRAQYRGGAEPADGDGDVCLLHSRTWVMFRRNGRDPCHVPGFGNEVVADTAWDNRAIVGFSASPDTQLPSHLTRSPDCRVEIRPLDARMLRTVIGEVAGRRPKAAVPEGLAARITPDILRFARRRRQSADAYLVALVALAIAPGLAEGRPGPTLDAIHGMDEAVAWGRRWILDLGEYRAGRVPWATVDAAALLHGLPGTGKTMFAEALARSAGVPLVSASFARWQSNGTGHLGECLKAMRASFSDAKRLAPCVLLIDEIDAVGTRQGDKGEHRDYWTAVVTGLLELLDGTEGREGVLVLGTTNDPGALDPALVRSGRLDRMIVIKLPDQTALEGILRHHLGDDLTDADIGPAARLALGGNGADCARWVRTARQSARQSGRPVATGDLLAAIGSAALSPEVEGIAAVHEAGHAVATAVLRPGSVMSARIGLSAGTFGAVLTVHDTRSTREAVHGALVELLAGRAAEEVLLGGYSGGSGGSASSDLAMATCHAVAIETALGLGSFGPLWQGLPTPDTVGTLLAIRPALAKRVQANLEAVYAEAVDLIRSNREAVSAVAEALIAMRSLTGAEIEALVALHGRDDSVVLQ